MKICSNIRIRVDRRPVSKKMICIPRCLVLLETAYTTAYPTVFLPKLINRSISLPTMELGFSISAGPLSQISVSVISIELAVQLATGAYGWWKARDRGRAMLGVVESKGCQISTTSTFNLLRYMDRRKDGLIRGVARDPDGVLSCVTLPNASSASSGDHGLVCLRAVICAVLCFYSPATTVEILVGALPGTLYTSNQEGGNDAIEGALLSSLRQFVKAAATEEDSDNLRQKLLDVVDSKLGNVTGATSKDVFECDNFLESDVPNFVGALRWILTPVLRRKQRVYPTRSLKVWALALIMAQLGFEVAVSMHAISSKNDYQTFVENVGHQPTYQEVILVTSDGGPTDPLNTPGVGFGAGQNTSAPNSNPRIGSIRSIPWIAFRHLQDNKGIATPKYLSEVWEFTFEYVFDILEPAKPSIGGMGLSVVLQFTKTALNSFGAGLHPRLAHIDKTSKFWNDFQWLTFVTFHPLKKFATTRGKDTIWNESGILDQFRSQGATSEYANPPGDAILDDWYITRAVVLATIYAVCCKWLYMDDRKKSLLDTEIAFCPDYIRRGNIATWTLAKPFTTMLLPPYRPASGFWSEIDHQDWFQMLVKVFSGVPNDPTIQARISRASALRDNSLQSVLGFQRNGLVLLPNILVYPSADSDYWFQYHIRIGQLLDLPLEEDGFICAANGLPRMSSSDIWKPDPLQQTTEIKNPPPDTIVRIDPEPWWEFDERTIVFRARVGGVVKAIFSPAALFQKYHSAIRSDCKCVVPKDEIQLKETVYTLGMSEYFLHASKSIQTYDGSRSRWLVVQSGGDPMAQLLCLAISNFDHISAVIGCIDVLQEQLHFQQRLVLL